MKLLLVIVLGLLYSCSINAQSEIKDTVKVLTSDIIREATFTGGEAAWKAYLKKILEKNIDALYLDNKPGKCIVRFVINEDGTISDVHALTMQDSKLAKICIQGIGKGPKWIPEMINGKCVKAVREEPISFSISNQ